MPKYIQLPPWDEEELTILRELYPIGGKRLTARALPRRSHRSVAIKASQLKLRSPLCGIKTRFKPGQTPWNKGLKYPVPHLARTQYKPGNKPQHCLKPVGYESIDGDGYLLRKVSDDPQPDGQARRNWVYVHVDLWEKHHGPVPPGHVVIFKNGNRSDIRIDNLEMISREELMARNTIHNYPKEVAQTIQLLGVLKRQINRRKNK